MGNSQSDETILKKSFNESELEKIKENYHKSYSIKGTDNKEYFDFTRFCKVIFFAQETKLIKLSKELNLNITLIKDVTEKEFSESQHIQATFKDYAAFVHLLSKSTVDETNKFTEFYLNCNQFSVIYDIFKGSKGSYDKPEKEIFQRIFAWLYQSYLSFCIYHNQEISSEDIETQLNNMLKLDIKESTINSLMNKYYNLESFLYNIIKNSFLSTINHHTNFGLPILFSRTKTITSSQFFLFSLMNPHIYGKKFAYKLFDCSESGFTLGNIVYSFLGFPGPVVILIQHFDKETGNEPVVGCFLNSGFKECYEGYCGDDLSFIFSIDGYDIKYYKYSSINNSDRIAKIVSKSNKYSKSKPGIGMGDFYDEPRLWIDGGDLFGSSYFSKYDQIFEHGTPFGETEKQVLNVSYILIFLFFIRLKILKL